MAKLLTLKSCLIAGLMTVGLGASALLWVEAKGFEWVTQRVETRDAEIPLVWSLRNRVRLLEHCHDRMLQRRATLLGAPELTACHQFAATISRQSPEWGLAWIVLARSQFHTDNPAALTSLAAALEFAPNEGWIAQKRVLLAFDMGQGAASILHRDLHFLLEDPRLSDWLAQLYAAAPSTREVITSAAAELSPATQRRFLAQTRPHLERAL